VADPRPAGPDPERDKRIDVYRDRERRRAARALDRYIEIIIGDAGRPSALTNHLAVSAAGDRFVEQVGDYVLARVEEGMSAQVDRIMAARDLATGDVTAYGASTPHHKSHYGAANPYEGKSIEELDEIMSSDGYLHPRETRPSILEDQTRTGAAAADWPRGIPRCSCPLGCNAPINTPDKCDYHKDGHGAE
jgi:hypothetical protein